MKSRPVAAVAALVVALSVCVGGGALAVWATASSVEGYRPGWTTFPTDDRYLLWSRGGNGFYGRVTRIGPLVIYTPVPVMWWK